MTAAPAQDATGSGAPFRRGLLVVLALYAGLRVLGWGAVTLFEDHDSAGYLHEARKFLTLDPAQFLNLGPDSNPVYPVLSAIASLPGWGVEFGARLVSFASSLGLFAALVAIGRRWGDRRGLLFGLACVALSPLLVGLSFAVLSEPVYIGLVYAGLAMFWWWYDDPRTARGAALGLIFGLTFLARTEGVLFAAFVPALQAIHFVLQRPRSYRLRQLATWTVAYIGVFAILAAPQVWNVSRQAGRLILNGRQIWGVLLTSQPERSYDERLYSLDYRPDSTNLEYLLAHPEALPKGTHVPLRVRARLVLRNFDQFNQSALGRMIGPVGLMLFGLGAVSLALVRPRFELLLLAGFLVTTLVGPLLHNVVLRHVAVMAPLVWLVAGVGIAEVARRLGGLGTGRLRPGWLEAACLGAVALVSVVPLREVLQPPDCNNHYCAAALAEPARLLRRFERDADRPAVVATRRFYVTALAESGQVVLPYTELPRLVRYLELHQADFVFLEQAAAGAFPFYSAFEGDRPPDGFRQVYRAKDAWGRSIALYRVVPGEPVPVQPEPR